MEASKKDKRTLILETLKEKSSLKQDVYQRTSEVFRDFKDVLKEIAQDLKTEVVKIDKRITVEYTDKGTFDAELKIAGDILFFQMHTNVFEFDKSHPVWKNSYVKKDEFNSYCGMISIYNFLNDSFKYSRLNDIGYLIDRIFINHDKHFFTEGKPQVSIGFTEFGNKVIDKESIKALIETTVLFCLNFDLFVPPYDSMYQVSLHDVQSQTNNLQLQTGKRLGFKFPSEDELII